MLDELTKEDVKDKLPAAVVDALSEQLWRLTTAVVSLTMASKLASAGSSAGVFAAAGVAGAFVAGRGTDANSIRRRSCR